jgi:hypothetical protein
VGTDKVYDSAEKPLRLPFDRSQGERREIKITDEFPFVLRLSKHERSFSAESSIEGERI